MAPSTDRIAMIELDTYTLPTPAAPPVLEHHTRGTLERVAGEVASARDLKIAADLDWRPEFAAIVTTHGTPVPESVGRAVVRSDTKRTIGIVGARYEIIDHDVLFRLADAIRGDSGGALTFGNAGALRGGAAPFVQLKIETDSPAGPVARNLSLFTSHDGSLRLTCGLSNTVIVCQNTHRHAYNDCADGLKIRHTAGAADIVAEVERIAALTGTYAQRWDNDAIRMLGTAFTDGQAHALASALIPGESKRAENSRRTFLDAYQSAPGAAPGSVWGAAQATTWYTSHALGSPEARAESAVFGTGTGADFMRSAWDVLDLEPSAMAAQLQTVSLLRV